MDQEFLCEEIGDLVVDSKITPIIKTDVSPYLGNTTRLEITYLDNKGKEISDQVFMISLHNKSLLVNNTHREAHLLGYGRKTLEIVESAIKKVCELHKFDQADMMFVVSKQKDTQKMLKTMSYQEKPKRTYKKRIY